MGVQVRSALMLIPLDLFFEGYTVADRASAVHKTRPTPPSKSSPATPTGSATWPGRLQSSKNPT